MIAVSLSPLKLVGIQGPSIHALNQLFIVYVKLLAHVPLLQNLCDPSECLDPIPVIARLYHVLEILREVDLLLLTR